MKPRFAILLDGAFVIKRLRKGEQKASPADVLAVCQRIRGHEMLRESELLRIHWYDAPPATGVLKNPLSGRQTNLGRTEIHRWATSLQDALVMQPDFALRLGEVSVSPTWSIREQTLKDIAKGKKVLAAEDIKPSIEQKGVDLRIGLDIARLALRQFVATIVVVTGDSDIVPAFKFARREGMRVYLDHLGSPHVKRDLKAHVDLIL